MSDKAKLKAIAYLVRHGARASEWQEAGLLHEIERVLDAPDEKKFSSKYLTEACDRARKN